MPSYEVPKALERQRKEAERRRERRQQTVDRIKDGRKVAPGVAPVGDPDELHQQSMQGEVNRLRRRMVWLMAFSVLLAAVAVWQGRIIANISPEQKFNTGIVVTAFCAVVVTGMMWARVVSSIRALGSIQEWRPDAVTSATRILFRVAGAFTVITTGLATAALLWMAAF